MDTVHAAFVLAVH